MKEVTSMKCEEARPLMMALLDGEIEEADRKSLERHLQGCYACAKELEGFRQLKELTEGVTLMEPETRVWQEYWSRVYNRVERGLGGVRAAAGVGGAGTVVLLEEGSLPLCALDFSQEDTCTLPQLRRFLARRWCGI